jgi:hypothetical protein
MAWPYLCILYMYIYMHSYLRGHDVICTAIGLPGDHCDLRYGSLELSKGTIERRDKSLIKVLSLMRV